MALQQHAGRVLRLGPSWVWWILQVIPPFPQEYIVVFIDGRGSGHQGWNLKRPLYGNFGTVEVDDQIATMR